MCDRPHERTFPSSGFVHHENSFPRLDDHIRIIDHDRAVLMMTIELMALWEIVRGAKWIIGLW
jgi:hypothetical protein